VGDNPNPDRQPDARPRGRCPICGRTAEQAFRPFCSARCADVDLQRWLAGAYVVPAADDEEVAGDERL
jgi:endogenous inhibitor of DNA gyrase (YacG/DUF329 family)